MMNNSPYREDAAITRSDLNEAMQTLETKLVKRMGGTSVIKPFPLRYMDVIFGGVVVGCVALLLDGFASDTMSSNYNHLRDRLTLVLWTISLINFLAAFVSVMIIAHSKTKLTDKVFRV